jgi:glucose/arabinose dehydrogenase
MARSPRSQGEQIHLRRTITAAAAALFLYAPAAAGGANFPPDFEERTVASGLTGPTGIAWAPDGRMFVIEKEGRLKVVAPNDDSATLVADLSDEVNSYWDRGLLGIAVDTSYATNNYVYLLYTRERQPMTPDDDGPMVSRLERFKINTSNQVVERTTILGAHNGPCPAPSNDVDCIPSEGFSHSIGSVRSAPDGTLWVGSGDAASFNFVDQLALRTYNPQSMAGKIMHIDREGRGLSGHPFCPGNPVTDVCAKIWAGGFRNPFRFKLRPGGGLTVGDVGWGTTEEVDLVPTAAGTAGRLYGWPCYEGSGRTGGYRDLTACDSEYAKEGTSQAHLGPVHQYAHTSAGGAVLGGPTYTGGLFPSTYQGDVFFADYVQGFIKRLNVNAQDQVTSVENFATDWTGVDVEQTPDGELAYASFGNGSAGTGSIRRIVYTPANRSPTAVIGANPTSGPAPLAVSFNGGGSTDPDGDPLTYQWSFGDGGTSTQASPSHTYTNPNTYTATLTVRDGRSGQDSETVGISAGNTPPQAVVTGDTSYRGGESFSLQGSASDQQQGSIPASGLRWDVRVIHGDHIHVLGSFLNRSELDLQAITDHDADAHYEITMTATDAGGLTDQATVTLDPETTTVRLDSSPAGAAVSYGGRQFTAPQELVTAIGYHTTISATDPFELGGAIFDFTGWSNGGARVQNFVVPPTGAELTANYTQRVIPPGEPPSEPPPNPPPPNPTPTPPDDPTPPPDAAGPALRLIGVNPSRGRIRGTATDPSGVSAVEVALRARLAGGECSWWLAGQRRMSATPRRCDRPRWIAARLASTSGEVQWLLVLGKRLPPGTYRVLVRGVDTAGNEGALPVGPGSLVRVARRRP